MVILDESLVWELFLYWVTLISIFDAELELVFQTLRRLKRL